MYLMLFGSHRRGEMGRVSAAERRVVKRACLGRENKGFEKALSPGPPNHVRNGESDGFAAQDRRTVSAIWTSVYVNAAFHTKAFCFTTRGRALLKANCSHNSLH